MDADTLRQAAEQAGFAAVGISFLAGFFFSLNPVAMAAIPVSVAYVTKAREPRQAALFGSMFILGMVVTHVVLGVVAGLGGRWVELVIGRFWGPVIGPVLILLGLMWPGWVRIPMPAFAMRVKRPSGAVGAFLFGVPFSIAICPVCTPALLVLLGVAAGLGSPLMGATLLLAFALGRAIPIAVGATAVGWLENLKRLAPYRHAFEVVGGLVLIAAGLYMLNAFFFWVPELAG